MSKPVPNTKFYTRVRDDKAGVNPFRWEIVESKDLFAGKRIVIVALPGAFTPTCSSTHLPGFEEKYDEIIAAGVDEVYCLSVNDAFTMFKWAGDLGVSKVKMLPDGNGDFTRQMGMLVKKDNLGFGYRSWRYSMVVDNGKIETTFIEPGKRDNAETDPFVISGVDNILEYLTV